MAALVVPVVLVPVVAVVPVSVVVSPSVSVAVSLILERTLEISEASEEMAGVSVIPAVKVENSEKMEDWTDSGRSAIRLLMKLRTLRSCCAKLQINREAKTRNDLILYLFILLSPSGCCCSTSLC